MDNEIFYSARGHKNAPGPAPYIYTNHVYPLARAAEAAVAHATRTGHRVRPTRTPGGGKG